MVCRWQHTNNAIYGAYTHVWKSLFSSPILFSSHFIIALFFRLNFSRSPFFVVCSYFKVNGGTKMNFKWSCVFFSPCIEWLRCTTKALHMNLWDFILHSIHVIVELKIFLVKIKQFAVDSEFFSLSVWSNGLISIEFVKMSQSTQWLLLNFWEWLCRNYYYYDGATFILIGYRLKIAYTWKFRWEKFALVLFGLNRNIWSIDCLLNSKQIE